MEEILKKAERLELLADIVSELSQTNEDTWKSIVMTLKAYRSIRGKVGYRSMSITTGKRYYDVFKKYGVYNIEDLIAIDKDILKNEIIIPNIEEGVLAADKLSQKYDIVVISPGVFEAITHRWSQEEYMFLWYQVLMEIINENFFAEDWGWTNGGAKEYVRCIQMQFGNWRHDIICGSAPRTVYMPKEKMNRKHDILMECIVPVTDDRREIKIEEGVNQIINPIKALMNDGFIPNALCVSLFDLVNLAYDTWDMQGKVYGPSTPYPFVFGNICQEVSDLIRYYRDGAGDKIINLSKKDKVAEQVDTIMNKLRWFTQYKDRLTPCLTRKDLIEVYNRRYGVDDFFHIKDILANDLPEAKYLKQYLRI